MFCQNAEDQQLLMDNRLVPRARLTLLPGGVSNVSAITTAQVEAWGEEPCIEWLGPTDAMEQVLAQVDCVVLPSYREGLPRSLLEAGAMGLPVVATDVPGCRHVVQHGVNGLLCEVRDAVALERAMGAVLAMPAQRWLVLMYQCFSGFAMLRMLVRGRPLPAAAGRL